MSDRLLIGTSRASAVMKAGKFRFRKGKEKQVGNAGWKDNSLAWGILLLPIYRIRKKGTSRQCVVWVGEVLFVRFTVNGQSNQLSGFCGWPCDGSGVNGRKVPQTKDYPFSHGKAQRRK